MKKHKTLKAHHAKPVRKRHLGMTAIGLGLLLLAAYLVGLSSDRIIESFETTTTNQTSDQENFSVVRSSLGFAFTVDRNIFSVEATEVQDNDAAIVPSLDLSARKAISSILVKPDADKVNPVYGATVLEITIDETESLSDDIANRQESATIESVVSDYYAPRTSTMTTVNQLSSSSEVLSGLSMERRVYQLTTTIGGELAPARTFSVHWSGLLNQRPINIRIDGLVGGSSIPPVYQPILDSLQFDVSVAARINNQLTPVRSGFPGFGNVSAQADQPLASKYLADLVSPSVVKIYSVVCGTIVIDTQAVSTGEVCNGGTGTGFFVSEDGYIGTNGHVVVQEPTDLFVYLLLSDPNVLSYFLELSGLSSAQIGAVLTDQQMLATIIASIYEQAEGRLSLQNERSKILVSVANEPVKLSGIEEFFNYQPSDTIYNARLVDYDYAASDLYAAQSIEQGDFTASDVALIKVEINNAPALKLASEEPTQNESLTVLGFPGDAENSLVSTDELAITVTNGVISSIREANGSDSKLYQSDVDASQGNSGGPAVNEYGDVIGLLTYRFKNEQLVDASKSYIRDIGDLVDLAEDADVTLSQGETFDIWQTGMEYYAQNRFSKAKSEFEKVTELYPAHRLASTYIDRSEQAIDEGRDVKDFPVILAIIGGIIGAGLAGGGVFLFVRHNKHHKLHLLSQVQNGQIGLMPGSNNTAPLSPSPSSAAYNSPPTQVQQVAPTQQAPASQPIQPTVPQPSLAPTQQPQPTVIQPTTQNQQKP